MEIPQFLLVPVPVFTYIYHQTVDLNISSCSVCLSFFFLPATKVEKRLFSSPWCNLLWTWRWIINRLPCFSSLTGILFIFSISSPRSHYLDFSSFFMFSSKLAHLFSLVIPEKQYTKANIDFVIRLCHCWVRRVTS